MKMLQCPNPCQLHHYFVDFVNMKCMSWITFLCLEKMELCFVLLVKEVKVFFVFGTETLICQISALGWLVGGEMGGVNCEASYEPHMFSLYFR